ASARWLSIYTFFTERHTPFSRFLRANRYGVVMFNDMATRAVATFHHGAIDAPVFAGSAIVAAFSGGGTSPGCSAGTTARVSARDRAR
ncbi:hypothetical protein, partial [Escherichia coli]|uniref:hypothetical protein n=1 Tax=Escherichia coli TaxID=562 RepID=UPI001BDD682C